MATRAARAARGRRHRRASVSGRGAGGRARSAAASIVDLATDERATRYGHDFPARATHVIPSATIRGRDPISLAKTAATLGVGAMKALLLLRRIRPVAVVGFGGYPTLPPVLAATLRRIPTVIHDANAVMGRANRMLAPRVTAIATSFPGMTLDAALAAKATTTGNPVRPMVLAAAAQPYAAPDARRHAQSARHRRQPGRARDGRRGAAGDRSDGAGAARAACDRAAGARRGRDARARGLRAARRESRGGAILLRSAGAHRGVASRRLALRRLDGRRACRHRPARRILVPLPHALDQDQLANATVLAKAGGAIVLKQDDFTPARLAGEIAALAADPAQACRHGGRREIGRRARCRGPARRSGVARGGCGSRCLG